MISFWADSDARRQQFYSAVTSQVTGGTFWRVRYNLFEQQYDPFALHPFKFEPIYPDYVFPVWATGTQHISEIYIRYRVNKDAAKAKWASVLDNWPDTVEYEEHWTQDLVAIVKNTALVTKGKIIIRVGSGDTWRTYSERIILGIVPFVYIPHVPDRGFYGIPRQSGTQRLVDEYNARLANVGDLVKQAALRVGKLRGVSTNNLSGKSSGLVARPWSILAWVIPTGIPPELNFEDPPSITPALIDYVRELERKSRDSSCLCRL